MVAVALGATVLAAVVRLAWLSDDCYVTLRTVENLLAGHGPVWNVDERVQAYTHPAWFWTLAAARWLSGEHYLTTIAVSVALTGFTIALLFRAGRTTRATIVLAIALLGSRAFCDFATSGLETPLTMALLAWLVATDGSTAPGSTRLFAVAALTTACGLTRLDLLPVAGAVLLGHVRREHFGRQFGIALAAALPLLGWLAFAAYYYGSPFPITAHAKALATGLPLGDVLRQGCAYVAITARHDPLTIAVVGGGLALGLVDRRLRARSCALGIGISCTWILVIGGDFMIGRFFVPAFVLALGVIARALATAPTRTTAAVATVCLVAPWLGDPPSWLRSLEHDAAPTAAERGVNDERRFYWRVLGLWSPHRDTPRPGMLSDALRRQGRRQRIVSTSSQAGLYPFVAGEMFHFVDPWLCDPLLMRLPTIDRVDWRIGHFTRGIPDGYLETLAFGRAAIEHPGLREYHAALQTLVHGDAGVAERLRALASWWSGAHEAERAAYLADEYFSPPRRNVALTALTRSVDPGTLWCDDPGVRLVGRGGLRITCDAPMTMSSLHVSMMPFTTYTFVFRRGGVEAGRTTIDALVEIPPPPDDDSDDVLGYVRHMLGLHRFDLPLAAPVADFDAIDVDATIGPWTIAGIAGIELRR